MWVCQRCGETHQDQFQECWKCFDKQMDEHVAVDPPPVLPPSDERLLRPHGFFLVLGSIAAVIGFIIILAIRLKVPGWSLFLAGALEDSILAGVIFGTMVGILCWVLIPYQPFVMHEEKTESSRLPD